MWPFKSKEQKINDLLSDERVRQILIVKMNVILDSLLDEVIKDRILKSKEVEMLMEDAATSKIEEITEQFSFESKITDKIEEVTDSEIQSQTFENSLSQSIKELITDGEVDESILEHTALRIATNIETGEHNDDILSGVARKLQ